MPPIAQGAAAHSHLLPLCSLLVTALCLPAAGTVRPVVCSPRSALATAVQAPPEKRAGAGLKEFLKEKTGVTGAGTLAFGLAALAISKELIIIHAEVRPHTHATHPRAHTIPCYVPLQLL